MRSATTSSSTPTSAHECSTKFHFLRQQTAKGRRASRTVRSAISSRRRRPDSPDYIGGVRGEHRASVSKNCATDSGPSTTTTTPSWPRRSPTGWPKLSPSACTSGCATSGATAAEKLSNDELIAEKFRGIRPAAGYPACPDHTEKGTLAAPRRREEHRHADHRVICDVAGLERQRALSSRTPSRATSGWGRSTATKSKTTRFARASPCERPSAGYRPTWATTRRAEHLFRSVRRSEHFGGMNPGVDIRPKSGDFVIVPTKNVTRS